MTPSILQLCLISVAASAHAWAQDDFGTVFARCDLQFVDGEFTFGVPVAIEWADLDSDGHSDFVCSVLQPGFGGSGIVHVGVAFSSGELRFELPVHLDGGQEPAGIAIADFNADGHDDICVADAQEAAVSIFTNLGDRQFSEASMFSAGNGPRAVRAEDLNGDNLPDLAVMDVDDSTISILLNDGKGGFTLDDQVFVPDMTPWLGEVGSPFPGPRIDLGDADGDGDLDIAVPAEDSIRLLLNLGNGVFELAPTLLLIENDLAYDVAFADVDGDRDNDLVAVSLGDPTVAVSVLSNEGDSWSLTSYSADSLNCQECAYGHLSIAVGDIDGDQRPEIVAGQLFFEKYTLLRNDGLGGFDPPEFRDVPDQPWVVDLSDVNGNDHLDLVVLSLPAGGDVRVHLNDGRGSFRDPDRLPKTKQQCCQGPGGMAAADLDLDGDVDVAVPLGNGQWPYQLNLFENLQAGEFALHSELQFGEPGEVVPRWIEAGDLNADGLPDLVISDTGVSLQEPGVLWILFNEGDMRFSKAAKLSLGERIPRRFRIADMNGDHSPDIVGWETGVCPLDQNIDVMRQVFVVVNDGAGGFSQIMHYDILEAPFEFIGDCVPVDLDNDGMLEVVAASGFDDGPGYLAVLGNDGNGHLSVERLLSTTWRPSSLTSGDFDNDGDVDVALMAQHGSLEIRQLETPYLQIFENNRGQLAVSQEDTSIQIANTEAIRAADVTGDGHLDLLLPTRTYDVVLHVNDGAGWFAPPRRLATLDFVVGIDAGDLDGDGDVDIGLVGSSSGRQFDILWNGTEATFCDADVNGDGLLNILDFVTFQQAFLAQELTADCDGNGRFENPQDFMCFQQLFLVGCN